MKIPAENEAPAPPPRGESRASLIRTATLFYGLLMMIPLWWQAASEGPNLFYPQGFSRADTIGGLILGVLAGLVVVGVSGVFMRRTRWGRHLAETFAVILGSLPRTHVWALAFLSGFGEEMFFRGLLQPYLGIVITSIVFGIAHFVPRRDLFPWMLFSVAAGFLLGWLYQFSGNLLAPIACHVIVNGINLTKIAKLLPRPAV